MIATAIANGLASSAPEVFEENDALLPFKITLEVLRLYLLTSGQGLVLRQLKFDRARMLLDHGVRQN
jgi:hypothetical protein